MSHIEVVAAEAMPGHVVHQRKGDNYSEQD